MLHRERNEHDEFSRKAIDRLLDNCDEIPLTTERNCLSCASLLEIAEDLFRELRADCGDLQRLQSIHYMRQRIAVSLRNIGASALGADKPCPEESRDTESRDTESRDTESRDTEPCPPTLPTGGSILPS